MPTVTQIPLIDLKAQYCSIQPELEEAVLRVLRSGHYILGPEVEALEKEIAAYCSTDHAVGVASGTDALELILRALGIGPGDEVITTALSFYATGIAIVYVGARPVFVDVDPQTATIDAAQIHRAITPRTKAVIPVHLYGHPCDMEGVMAVAREARLKVIEDCAQAIGAEYKGRRVGSFGDAAALSFYPTKNLGGAGDGGMALTSDDSLAQRLRMLRWYGSRDRALFEEMGRNSRLDEIQAAILRVKLRHLERWNEARRQHAQYYTRKLSAYAIPKLILPVEKPGCRHVYHLYPIRVPNRQALKQQLADAGIASQVHYDRLLPEQPLLKQASAAGHFPVAQDIARTVCSIPLFAELTPQQIDHISEVVAQSVGH